MSNLSMYQKEQNKASVDAGDTVVSVDELIDHNVDYPAYVVRQTHDGCMELEAASDRGDQDNVGPNRRIVVGNAGQVDHATSSMKRSYKIYDRTSGNRAHRNTLELDEPHCSNAIQGVKKDKTGESSLTVESVDRRVEWEDENLDGHHWDAIKYYSNLYAILHLANYRVVHQTVNTENLLHPASPSGDVRSDRTIGVASGGTPSHENTLEYSIGDEYVFDEFDVVNEIVVSTAIDTVPLPTKKIVDESGIPCSDLIFDVPSPQNEVIICSENDKEMDIRSLGTVGDNNVSKHNCVGNQGIIETIEDITAGSLPTRAGPEIKSYGNRTINIPHNVVVKKTINSASSNQKPVMIQLPERTSGRGASRNRKNYIPKRFGGKKEEISDCPTSEVQVRFRGHGKFVFVKDNKIQVNITTRVQTRDDGDEDKLREKVEQMKGRKMCWPSSTLHERKVIDDFLRKVHKDAQGEAGCNRGAARATVDKPKDSKTTTNADRKKSKKITDTGTEANSTIHSLNFYDWLSRESAMQRRGKRNKPSKQLNGAGGSKEADPGEMKKKGSEIVFAPQDCGCLGWLTGCLCPKCKHSPKRKFIGVLHTYLFSVDIRQQMRQEIAIFNLKTSWKRPREPRVEKY